MSQAGHMQGKYIQHRQNNQTDTTVAVEPGGEEEDRRLGIGASPLQYWMLCNGTSFQRTMIEENTLKFCCLQVEIILDGVAIDSLDSHCQLESVCMLLWLLLSPTNQ